MPAKRKAGIIVSSYTVPATLHATAAARAVAEATTLTAVIRAALRVYVDQPLMHDPKDLIP
ncbi:MAG: hypothetical protein LH624_01520 [Cryobacterium sp.]|nr:hypothetical protein [Cryobacterium sp.]